MDFIGNHFIMSIYPGGFQLDNIVLIYMNDGILLSSFVAVNDCFKGSLI